MGSREPNSMDIGKILDELRAERREVEEAIRSLEELARGLVPNRMADDPGGRPPSESDPGSQPPPAAPAAARISTRLDRAVSRRKSPKAT